MNIPKIISFITTIGSLMHVATMRFGQAGKREVSESDNQATSNDMVIAGDNSEYVSIDNKNTVARIKTVLGININDKHEQLTATINSFADKWDNIEDSQTSYTITNSDYDNRSKRSIKRINKLTKHFNNSITDKIEHDNYKFPLNVYSESEMQNSRLENIKHEVFNTLKKWYQHYAPNS